MRVLPAGVCLSALLVACTPADEPLPSDKSGTGASQSAVGVGTESVYQQWLDRPELRSCGEPEEPKRGWNYPQSAACLNAAYEAQEGAEAVLTYWAMEGGQVRMYARVLPDGSVEVFRDETEDMWGSGWHYEDGCSRLWAKLLPLTCQL